MSRSVTLTLISFDAMNLEKLYAQLSMGALSNLNFAEEGMGTIAEQHRPMVVMFTNEALLRLYSRFILLTKDLLVEQYAHITYYHLRKRFAYSNWVPLEEKVAYIVDQPEDPFTEDVIKILQVSDSRGAVLPLNDAEHVDSVYTPQAKLLQVPRPKAGVALSILYQARHPEVTGEDLEQEIDVPDVLLSALLAYVGYQAFASVNTEVSLMKSQEQLALYETLGTEAEDKDLVSTSISSTNVRFNKRGWV